MKKREYLWRAVLCIIIASAFVLILSRTVSLRNGYLDTGTITSSPSQSEAPNETQMEGWFVGDSFDVLSFEDEINRFRYQGENVGSISNAQDAASIAGHLWSEVFDYDLELKKPFVVRFDANNRVWLVYGSLPPKRFGGVPHVLMDTEGNVLAIWHTR